MPSPSLSPRVQAFSAQPPTNDQAKTLFEQGLSQMAYNVLLSKLPNVAPDVVTFKILDSEPEKGNGVGSFVVVRQGLTFYVPVVMAENQIKPLDLLFYKDMNVFLPLTKEWLEQLGKQSVGELGQGVKPPNTLSTDVDIRNTVVPPTTGRYSYASDKTAFAGQPFAPENNSGRDAAGAVQKALGLPVLKPNVLSAKAAADSASSPFESLAVETPAPKLAFLDFIGKAPNRVKKAAADLFETRPKLLKLAARYYGKTALTNALAFSNEKVADYGYKLPVGGGAVYIADKSTEAGKFKEIFGDDAGIAYQGMLRKGFHAKDTRPEVKKAVKVQPFMTYEEPRTPGAYKLWESDGKPVLAFIISDPVDLTDPRANRVPARNLRVRPAAEVPGNPAQGHGVNYRMPGTDGTEGRVFVSRYVGVTEDGKLINVTKLIGSNIDIGQLEGSAVYKKTVGEAAAAGPRVGQTGFFVMRKGGSFVGTRPVRIQEISNDSNGTKLIKILGTQGLRTLAINEEHANGMLLVPATGLVHVPANYAWIPTSGEITESELMTNPKDALRFALNSVTKTAAERVIVKKAYHGFTFGDSSRQGFEFVDALRKLATDSGISVDDAEFALKQADEHGRFEFYAMSKADEAKLAEIQKKVETSSSGEINLDSFHKLNPKSKPKLKQNDAGEIVPDTSSEKTAFLGFGSGFSRKERKFMESDEYKKGNKQYYAALNRVEGAILKKHKLTPKTRDSYKGDSLTEAMNHPDVRKWEKYAAEGDAPPKKKPAAEPAADPAQEAMDATMMAQQAMQPQGPSPVDMAVAEQLQNLQAQMGALTQMQQLVQTIQQRANQIAGSGGAQGNPAAAAAAMGGPMDPSMMGAGAPSSMGAPPPAGGQPGMDPNAPPAGGQPPMDPNAQMQGAPPAGGQPPMQGGQPPMQGGQPGMDPNAQMQGQDPNAEQPPQAMMAADDGDINSMAQQVNPQFMEQAGQLNDAGTFDAAALASMAQSPVLRDLVQAYLPNLEKSLDNVGRVMLTLWMDESHVKEDIGAETFVGLEDNLRTVFKSLGELILKVNQNALVLREKNESIFQG